MRETQDYHGNNRTVINGSTGATEQTIAYYSFGAVIAGLGTPTTGQPYKFRGKELLTTNGLNEYDFGARNYYPAVPGFTRPDPLCVDTQHLSPYLYCGNNPVNAFDPDGRSTWVVDAGDDKYRVVGGKIDDNDRRVYLCTIDKSGQLNIKGKTIGITATMYSFYDSDFNNGQGAWMINSIIDTKDNSGDRFLSSLVHQTPPLFNDYMENAGMEDVMISKRPMESQVRQDTNITVEYKLERQEINYQYMLLQEILAILELVT